ncbi:MAG TPA: AbiV family abortive infection protein [Steroidobacteraceae bacterium]|jgi:hypothetical protein|nr:AbiV family abortive infection protein [Steroidobacteraceae bacterium]
MNEPVVVSDAALRAVAANSFRHLLDADQHYKAGRFPSAIASAVLAIEEAGKLSWITAHGKAPKEKRHAAHAMLFLALLKGLQSWPWTAEWVKFYMSGASPSDVSLTAQQQKDIAAHPELAEFVRRLQAGELADSTERLNAFSAATVEKEKREGTYQSWESLFGQGLQYLRLRATYVDISPAGDALTDPSTLDESSAKFLCTGAVAFVILALLIAKHQRKGLELQSVFASAPAELTGAEAVFKVLYKLIPGLQANAEAAELLRTAEAVVAAN